ncbi:MAG: NADH-quinone oxidoreductase subunit H [Deltaproteobacteria bacterium]|nr:NADH-quinone oxidoreductase subunit H [Deltaproteobacteria bacterium]
MTVIAVAHAVIHLLLVLALPPLMIGVVNKTKAFFAGRAGPPLLQPYHDLAKLLGKGVVLSKTTSWIFLAGPAVGLATTFCAALLVPLGGHAAPVRFDGDFVLFAYALGLGRFFTVAAALDTGSAFEGMGGAREATFACLAEPAVFFGMLVLARSSGSYSLSVMMGQAVTAMWSTSSAALAAVLVSWFVVLLAENSRIPFDDPNTHLELTMIHEVMVLDHGGPPLAVILYGAAMKLFVFGAVLIAVALPGAGRDPWLAWAVFVGATLLLSVVVGVVESVMARLRLPQVANILIAAGLISAFGAVLLVR